MCDVIDIFSCLLVCIVMWSFMTNIKQWVTFIALIENVLDNKIITLPRRYHWWDYAFS